MPRWLRNLIGRDRFEKEMNEEVRFHLDMVIQNNIRAGMSPEEARGAALFHFGGVDQTKEECRDTRWTRIPEEIWQDLRYAVRMMRKSPGFTMVVVIILALGIGANTAVFSIIDAVVFRPLPVWHPEQLAAITSSSSYPDFLDIRNDDQVFSGVAALSHIPLELSNDEHPEGFAGRCVSANFFQVLGLRMAVGRGFMPDEDNSPGSHPVAVITYRFWEHEFGSDPAVLGKTLKLNGESLTIVGVAPKGFRDFEYLGANLHVWVPISMLYRVQHLEKDPIWHDVLEARDKRLWLGVIGRLKPGVKLRQAQARMRLIAGQLKEAYPKTNSDWEATLGSVGGPRFPGGNTQFFLAILLAAAICILLITCTNVGSLMLGRASARQREIATRLALGASRSRVVRQLLTEGVTLSGLAFVASLAVWGLTLRYLPYIEGSFNAQGAIGNPRDMELALDYRVSIIAICITLLTNLIFGMAPALVASRPELNSALKNQGFLFAGRAGSRWLRIPVVVQVALSVILLVGAGLFIRTIVRFQSVDPGFDQNVLLLNVGKPFRDFDVEKSISYYHQALERIRTVPGVLSASLARDIPPERGDMGERMRPEQNDVSENRWHWFDGNCVTPGYFKTLGMPIIRGRDFTDHDDGKSAGVVIVNETLARRYWPGLSPLGKRLRVKGDENSDDYRPEENRSYEIIGVVPDAKYSTVWKGAKPYVYFPLSQLYYFDPQLHVRVSGNPSPIINPIRKALESFGPDAKVYNARLMSAEMESLLSQDRSTAFVLGAFGLLALILTAVGLYGVISYFVAQRTQEFGIRMALGAQAEDILKQVVREGMTLVSVGLALGLPCSMTASRFIGSRLHGMSPVDPVTYITISLLCIAVALCAVFLPARRATANPMDALRFE
jgi:putative ABC transport system permease protein